MISSLYPWLIDVLRIRLKLIGCYSHQQKNVHRGVSKTRISLCCLHFCNVNTHDLITHMSSTKYVHIHHMNSWIRNQQVLVRFICHGRSFPMTCLDSGVVGFDIVTSHGTIHPEYHLYPEKWDEMGRVLKTTLEFLMI